VEETRVPGGNHRPVASHWQIYHIMLYLSRVWTHNFSGDRHWLYSRCRSNNHTIMTTMAPTFCRHFCLACNNQW